MTCAFEPRVPGLGLGANVLLQGSPKEHCLILASLCISFLESRGGYVAAAKTCVLLSVARNDALGSGGWLLLRGRRCEAEARDLAYGGSLHEMCSHHVHVQEKVGRACRGNLASVSIFEGRYVFVKQWCHTLHRRNYTGFSSTWHYYLYLRTGNDPTDMGRACRHFFTQL